jgi:hypothetical protein
MATPQNGKSRKGGKKNRKFGRNAGRAASNKTQEQRTHDNKRKAIKRDADAKIAAKRKKNDGFIKGSATPHGTARMERRTKQRWVKAMSTAKAKKAEARKIAEAALHGGHIVALPTAQSLALVAAWQRAKAAHAARAENNRNKLVKV